MSSSTVIKRLYPALILVTVAACSGGSHDTQITPSANPPPETLSVTITSPADGASFVRGDAVKLSGDGQDSLHGPLAGSALSWSSSRDGSLGVGAQMTLKTLSVGTHKITLTGVNTSGDRQTADVTISIMPITPNTAPAPTAPPITTDAGFSATSQVSINDPDTVQTHTFAITTFPSHGMADLSPSGLLTYTPTPGFTNAGDSLTVTVTDDGSPRMSGSVTIPITVQGPVLNLPPTVAATAITTVEGVPGSTQVTVTDPVAPDQPPGMQHYTYAVSTVPQNGSASIDAIGGLVYTPNSGFTGQDSLVVTVTDDGTPSMAGAVLIDVTVEPAFAFVMTSRPNPVRPGHRVFYSITYNNQGTADIPQVTGVTDPSPPYGLVYKTEITGGGGCGFDICDKALYIQWPDPGTLAPGETHTVYFALAVNASTANGLIPPDGTSIHNGASITHDGGTFAVANQDVRVMSTPGVALSVVEDRDPVGAGDQLTYTLTMSNAVGGPTPPNDWALRATVPEWTEFVSADGGVTPVNGVVQWVINTNTFNPGTTLQYRYTVRVMDTAQEGSVVQTHAEVDDTFSAENYAQAVDATVIKSMAPLFITVTPNQYPIQPAPAGQPVSYFITVSNLGSTTVHGINLTDVTPNDSEVVVATGIGNGGTCGANVSLCTEGSIITWPPFDLDPNFSLQYSFTLTPVSDPTNTPDGTLIHNTVRVSYDLGDFSLDNDVVVGQGGGPVATP
jgi:uncharacterized repeat protein (TIGR01451 family)